MKIDYVSAAVGLSAFAAGTAIAVWHNKKRRQSPPDGSSQEDLLQRNQQCLRRTQSGTLLALLGLLIFLSDFLPLVTQSARIATVYVIFILFLALWLVLMGMADAMASRAALRRSLRQQRTARRTTIDSNR
jgi:NhaP-type Na+/H+ or K+/H+ antiporter